MISVDLDTPGRVLAIGAHPDDVEFGCGATLAKWAAVGCEVHLLVLTDGSKGSWDPTADPATLAEARKSEQQAAADALGASAVRSLELVDGELDSGRSERELLCAAIRQARPDVILGHDPWKRYRLHPDHRHAGRLTIDAIVAARDPHYFPALGLAPHRPAHALLFEAEVVDHLESVDHFLDAKLTALLCHRSQWRSTMGIDVDDPALDDQLAAFDHRVRSEAVLAGEHVGGGTFEAFKLLTDL
ncbi:MAG: PIG-L family deacetylase [Acidimicrobiia bacterium]